MGTKIITTCDMCLKERSSPEEVWLNGTVSTDGSSVAKSGGGIYCSKECLMEALEKFLEPAEAEKELQ